MWIDEYKELMFGIENDDRKTIKAIKMKNENMPEVFYKYRTVAEYTLNAFENDELYFSAISLFNDPYECAMSLSFERIQELTYNEIITQLRPFLKPSFTIPKEDFSSEDIFVGKITSGLGIPKEDESNFKAMLKFTDDLIKRQNEKTSKEISLVGDDIYRVCSFSELNDSLLMWAHYANNHQGFCIGYNFKELQNDITDLILPVIYSDELLEISKYLFPKSNKSLIMNAITRKSREREYEKEWRMLMQKNNNEKNQSQKLPVPKSVFLGTRISNQDRKAITEIASKKNIAIYQMYMGVEEFKLYYKRI